MLHSARFASLSLGSLLAAGTALLLGGCSAERHNVVGRTYQNITARDNGYFLAREKMRAEEAKLYKERPNDYNRILPLFPVVDSIKALQLTAAMDEVVKKASIPVVRHSSSDWTDDAYILIGKTRFYKREFEEATKTFKYVNTTSKDANARHEALIWLMRTYMVTKQWDNAEAVSDLLDKEEGTPANARELFLTRAQYYLHTGDDTKVIDNLKKAIPHIPKKDERSRTRYILAQLYQNHGQDKEAYAELNQILKRNPPYELDFFAKLMLGQVSDLNLADRARLNKYFANLLKDPKNKEYRDKIYYEMARLDYRQQHYDAALKLLNQSVRANTTNKAQRGYSYLLTGRIYYENLQKYRLAAAYYDSTTQSLPRETPDYAAIKERSDILRDFAQQITIVETQDSLLNLVKLDSAALRTRLLTYADAEMLRRKREEERQAALAARSANASAAGFGGSTGAAGADPLALGGAVSGQGWYFDNPTALSKARGDFQRKWGNRPLTDNWRVSSLATTGAPTGGTNAPVAVTGPGQSVVNPADEASSKQATAADERKAIVAQYREGLPFAPEQQQQALAKVQEALFALGGIYNQQLKEADNATQTYEQLLQRFPKGPHTVETYYTLYLIYKERGNQPKAEEYAQRLRQEYPNSSYARLVADPEYLRRSSVANAEMAVRLDSAFTFYKKQEFKKATASLARARKQFPQTDLNDRAEYLQALLVLRTQPPTAHKAVLTAFVKNYPESPLLPRVQELLNTYTKYEAGSLAGALASTEKPVVSFFRPGEVDNRLRIDYDNLAPTPAPLPAPGPAPLKQEEQLKKAPEKVQLPQPAQPAGVSAGPQPDAAKAPATPLAPTPTPDPTDAPASLTTPPAAPAAEPSPYAANLNAAHAVVIAYPKDAPAFANLETQLAAYNNRFYKASNLQIQAQPLGADQQLLIVQGLPNSRVAQSYALKLRSPQGPLMRLRNAGYQSFLIGIDNLPVLLTRGNLEEYLRFAQPIYSIKN